MSFFFQAEDGIRDLTVTGVQTCALPIWRLLGVPADPAQAAKLARHFDNDALGDIDVRREGGSTVFDFGEFRSEVATRNNPDGSLSFITIAPGIEGFEFVVSDAAGKRLTIRDAQHEYVFIGS